MIGIARGRNGRVAMFNIAGVLMAWYGLAARFQLKRVCIVVGVMDFVFETSDLAE